MTSLRARSPKSDGELGKPAGLPARHAEPAFSPESDHFGLPAAPSRLKIALDLQPWREAIISPEIPLPSYVSRDTIRYRLMCRT
jgi:hypothetical protein